MLNDAIYLLNKYCLLAGLKAGPRSYGEYKINIKLRILKASAPRLWLITLCRICEKLNILPLCLLENKKMFLLALKNSSQIFRLKIPLHS